MNKHLLLEISPPIASVTLNRVERHNSLVPELLEELLLILDKIAVQEQLGALVFQANGRSFSTGGDLKAFIDHMDRIAEYAERIVGALNQVMCRMIELPKPIVVAVHGMVTGGSFGLVLASDVVLLAPEASFTPYYGVVGFSPDGGWSTLLPRIIGPKRAANILLRNLTITSQQALEWGLAEQIVPPQRIRQRARETALELAQAHPGSVQKIKRLASINYGDYRSLLEQERIHFVQQISTPQAQDRLLEFWKQMQRQ